MDMSYKCILTIQDISCIGQCSMTVALPIMSACGHEVCILPAAVLSTHTGGFGKPAVVKLGDFMEATVSHWKENGITFDLVYVGYLGSLEAVGIAQQVMDTMVAPGGITVVDPALADHGKLYSGLSEEYAQAMFRLCQRADVMIPNVTEAAMMAGIPYRDELDEDYVHALLKQLPGKQVLLTGVGFVPEETGFGLRTGEKVLYHTHPKLSKNYSGTGDIFASAFCGALASGKVLAEAGRIAAEFTLRCIEHTAAGPAHWYGVKFETALPELIGML